MAKVMHERAIHMLLNLFVTARGRRMTFTYTLEVCFLSTISEKLTGVD